MVRATNAGGEAISIADVIVQGAPEPPVFISPPPAQVSNSLSSLFQNLLNNFSLLFGS